MGIEQISKACRLLRYGCKDDHAIYKTDNYPVDLVLCGRSASVPTKKREPWNTNK